MKNASTTERTYVVEERASMASDPKRRSTYPNRNRGVSSSNSQRQTRSYGLGDPAYVGGGTGGGKPKRPSQWAAAKELPIWYRYTVATVTAIGLTCVLILLVLGG